MQVSNDFVKRQLEAMRKEYVELSEQHSAGVMSPETLKLWKEIEPGYKAAMQNLTLLASIVGIDNWRY